MFFVCCSLSVSSLCKFYRCQAPSLSVAQLCYQSGAMKESHVLTFSGQKYKEYSFLAITRP